MEWNLLPKLLIARLCIELAKNKYKGPTGREYVEQYAVSLYTHIKVECSYINNLVLFAYKGQQIMEVHASRVTTHNSIRLSEEEAEKVNAMIGIIDMLD